MSFKNVSTLFCAIVFFILGEIKAAELSPAGFYGVLCDGRVLSGQGYGPAQLDPDYARVGLRKARAILRDKIRRLDPKTATRIDQLLSETIARSQMVPGIRIEFPDLSRQQANLCRNQRITKAYYFAPSGRIIFSADDFHRLSGAEQLQLLLEASLSSLEGTFSGAAAHATAYLSEQFSAHTLTQRIHWMQYFGGREHTLIFSPHLFAGLSHFEPETDLSPEAVTIQKGSLVRAQSIRLAGEKFEALGAVSFYGDLEIARLRHAPKRLAGHYGVLSDETGISSDGQRVISAHVPFLSEEVYLLPTRHFGRVTFRKQKHEDFTFYFTPDKKVWKACQFENSSLPTSCQSY